MASILIIGILIFWSVLGGIRGYLSSINDKLGKLVSEMETLNWHIDGLSNSNWAVVKELRRKDEGTDEV